MYFNLFIMNSIRKHTEVLILINDHNCQVFNSKTDYFFFLRQ